MIRTCDDNGDNEALRWRDAVPNPRGSEGFCAISRVTIKAVLSQIKSSSMARIPGECFSAGEEKAVGRNDRLSLLDKKAKPLLRHTDRTEQAHIGTLLYIPTSPAKIAITSIMSVTRRTAKLLACRLARPYVEVGHFAGAHWFFGLFPSSFWARAFLYCITDKAGRTSN